jgi:hypothetical protein
LPEQDFELVQLLTQEVVVFDGFGRGALLSGIQCFCDFCGDFLIIDHGRASIGIESPLVEKIALRLILKSADVSGQMRLSDILRQLQSAVLLSKEALPCVSYGCADQCGHDLIARLGWLRLRLEATGRLQSDKRTSSSNPH